MGLNQGKQNLTLPNIESISFFYVFLGPVVKLVELTSNPAIEAVIADTLGNSIQSREKCSEEVFRGVPKSEVVQAENRRDALCKERSNMCISLQGETKSV